jgi:hypothetical protein
MKIKIELNANQLAVLDAALAEVPYKHAAPLVAHINAAIKEARETPPPEPTTQAGPPPTGPR